MKTYLYHLDKPLGRRQNEKKREQRGLPPRKQKKYKPHAQHYIGKTGDPDGRDDAHQSGHGSRMLHIAKQAGIKYTVVRTWEGDREKELKARHDARALCPVCNPTGWRENAKGST